MFENPLVYYAMLFVAGLVAGFINTVAGGGSNLTLPALMVLGMPADVANGTNRISVVLQGLVGTAGFAKHKKLDLQDFGPILLVTTVGAVGGALVASYIPNSYLKPLLLGTMIAMALIILIRPEVIAPEPGTPINMVRDTPAGWASLLFAGFYGGFVQAGVGFVLLGALAGTLRYDIVRANALKVITVFLFTLIALGIFIARGQVQWLPGLALAVGSMLGAHISVGFAVSVSNATLKWFLFLMTLVAAAAAIFL